nr:MAG TPA: tail-collar fiber protein [Caudoviricetes sp.]
MAWSQAILTAKGRELSAKALAGRLKLNFTEVWIGDGNLTNIETATELAHKRIRAGISEIIQDEKEGTCKVKIVTSNETLTGSSLVIREIGFYMQDEAGRTVLFSAMKNDEPQTLPLMGNNGPSTIRNTVAFGYSNANDVRLNVTVNEGQTAEQVKQAIQAHGNDLEAHGLGKYAGGATIPSNIRNWNDLTKPGIYEGNANNFGWPNAPSQTKVYPYGQIQVHKTDGNVIIQEFYSYGQGKPCKRASRTFYNAWGAWQYFGDWDNVITGIAKHTEGINVTKGDATELIKLITNNKSDSNTLLAPTLSVVKALIGEVNVDVTSLLKSKGVRFDFSNENAWYICFGEAFGGLIIQGGIKAQLHVYNETIVFPIAFKKVVNVSVTPVGISGTNPYKSFVRVNELSAQNFMANSDDVTISKLYWIAYGI